MAPVHTSRGRQRCPQNLLCFFVCSAPFGTVVGLRGEMKSLGGKRVAGNGAQGSQPGDPSLPFSPRL